MLDAVENELSELRGEAHGTQLRMTLSRPSSRQSGGRALNLPDLLAHYPCGHFPAAVHSRGIGRVEKPLSGWRKGNHRDGGFVIASGPTIARLIPQVQAMTDIGKLARDVLSPASQAARWN